MKRLAIFFVTVLTLSMVLSATAFATGNGAPQGAPDYQLNIIGTTSKSPDMTVDLGRRIFVPLEGKTKIYLFQGDYEVLDANGTDGSASFQLPKPGLDAYIVGDPGDADVWSAYSVYIRPLGKPGGWATITTCADLLDSTFGGLLGGDTRTVENAVVDGAFCSLEQVTLIREKGKSTFQNVTAELLTIVFEVTVWTDADGDGIVDPGETETFLVRVPIFDAALEGEFWYYENNGLRLAQVRFYDCSTNVETGETTC